MIIISNERTVAVQSCSPSMIYTAKSGIRVTTTVEKYWMIESNKWERERGGC